MVSPIPLSPLNEIVCPKVEHLVTVLDKNYKLVVFLDCLSPSPVQKILLFEKIVQVFEGCGLLEASLKRISPLQVRERLKIESRSVFLSQPHHPIMRRHLLKKKKNGSLTPHSPNDFGVKGKLYSRLKDLQLTNLGEMGSFGNKFSSDLH